MPSGRRNSEPIPLPNASGSPHTVPLSGSGVGGDTPGILVSPGYQYASVENDIFLTKEQTHEKFRAIRELSQIFSELAGEKAS